MSKGHTCDITGVAKSVKVGGVRKDLGRFWSRIGLYVCPICRENEDLKYFFCNCKEMKDLTADIFGIGVKGRVWMVGIKKKNNCKMDIKNVGRYAHLAM